MRAYILSMLVPVGIEPLTLATLMPCSTRASQDRPWYLADRMAIAHFITHLTLQAQQTARPQLLNKLLDHLLAFDHLNN